MMGLREEKKQRLRQEIAQAALELFLQRGYEHTRVREIAARVGISEATYFNYFPAKEHVLDELALAQVQLLRRTIAYQRAAADRVEYQILEVMLAGAAATVAEPDVQALLYTRSNLFHPSGLLKRRTLELHHELAALFDLGKERREIRTADSIQLAEMALGIYHFTTLHWLTEWWGERDNLENRMAAAIRIFLDGALER